MRVYIHFFHDLIIRQYFGQYVHFKKVSKVNNYFNMKLKVIFYI